MVLPEVCVVYLLRSTAHGDEVLLGLKKTGLGAGKIVGPGGKLERGETPPDAAVRELHEEVGVRVNSAALVAVAELEYVFPFSESWTQKSWAFICREWKGDPVESDEIRPEWVRVDQVPFDAMWDDARHWLGDALQGRSTKGVFEFGSDNRTVAVWSLTY